LEDLEPRPVWAHFATLCAIPHPSGHEAALRDHLIGWAGRHGIATTVDPVGNLILRKPASPGCEDRPGVILQGHLDMVSQANAGTRHDFERDPIRAVVRDGWLVAEQTTLGADNGIGVALALAALTEPGLRHPPLEVLLTVNEESGMDGARGLAPSTLRGRRLINLDTEEWGHFYLGCAGGVDVEVRRTCVLDALPATHETWRIGIAGLRGGHSGIDIASGRGNAIKLLGEALLDLAGRHDPRLIGMQGGTARNAIPRETGALIALPAGQSAALADWAAERLAGWQARLAETDPGVALTCEPARATGGQALARAERDRLLAWLAGAANGAAAMSKDFPGVVETSDNLGVLELSGAAFHATFKVRSLHDTHADALADAIAGQARGHGLEAGKDGAYPGWRPDPDSPLLALCQRVYAERFGRPAGLRVIHAGLECGLLAASHPHLDMISFGPDIRGAHAPGERVEIESVARSWDLLKAILGALAED
jgi:dipeptidase D